MPQRLLLCLALLAGAFLLALCAPCALAEDTPNLVAPTEAISAEAQQKMFHLPPGFAIQLIATEPEIRKPMNLNFDVHGRLYVTQSEEYPYPAKEGQPRRDCVKRFEDIGPDGRPGRIVTVVDGLNIPIGQIPREDGIIYYSIPAIYRATDPDQDGRYQNKQLLYGQFGTRDTHGMASSFTRWVDGWIYACHGYANDSEIRGADDRPVKMNSGNTYRFRPDGSHVEQFTHGQVNPFGMAMDPLGNLYTSDCHTKPIYMLLRGAWYPSFGKPHDGLGYGPEMIEHLHESTGIAGVVYYAADHFPPEYRHTVFIGNPVTGRVNHDRLEAHGSSYKAIARPDFITCDDPWFRPVDLKLGPDGALYIADFYNCIIGHYEVPLAHPRRDRSKGRLWRVVYTGIDGKSAPPQPMADLTKLGANELGELLGHPNITVRVLAAEQSAAQPSSPGIADGFRKQLLRQDAIALEAAANDDDPSALRRAHSLWLVERGTPGGLDAETIVRLASDSSRLVRVHLVKMLAERSDWRGATPDLYALVREKLSDTDAFVRRAAADALGCHPDRANVEPLLALWAATPTDDTHLIHVARMALRDQLLAPNVYGQLAALIEKDPTAAARLAEVSLGVRNADSAAFLLTFIERNPADDARLAEYVHDIARYLPEARFAELLRHAQTYTSGPPERQQAVLMSLARAAQERNLPASEVVINWGSRLAGELLSAAQEPAVQRGIELARELRLATSFDRLAALAGRDASFAKLRPAAIDACVANDGAKAVPVLAAIVGDSAEPMPLRQKAAAALAVMNSPASRAALVEQIRVAPDRLALEIARGLGTSLDGSEALLAVIVEGKASARLLQDTTLAQRMAAAKVPDLASRVAKLTTGLPPADSRLQEMVDARRRGFAGAQVDVAAGSQAFAKVCAACHLLGGKGEKIGPGLDGVGIRGLDRLLEDTLDPSRNVDQAFRTTVIATTGGNVILGLQLGEEGDVLILADPQGKKLRIPRSEIDELTLSPQSPMPANVADILTEAEYYNLLAYLLEQRQKQ